MAQKQILLIAGASVRAAAFSALRAGLQPWCVDLFADADLRARCPATAISPERYPNGLREILARGPAGPWMYTGALENHPRVIAAISKHRPLWGVAPSSLRTVRDPAHVAHVCKIAGIPCPEVRGIDCDLDTRRRWLLKPFASAGGTRIQLWTPGSMAPLQGYFFQEFLDGPSWSAVYVSVGDSAVVLGVSQQLIGEPWLHARPFQYCGSISIPCETALPFQNAFEHIGAALAENCGVRGLFGVDCVMHDGLPWPVEVNPRYTASVEVAEYARGMSALGLHRRAFETAGSTVPSTQFAPVAKVVGKAIIFAKTAFLFPDDGPWNDALRDLPPIDALPRFADIPRAGQGIEQGWPVLTVFATARTTEDCIESLKREAAALDRWLYR